MTGRQRGEGRKGVAGRLVATPWNMVLVVSVRPIPSFSPESQSTRSVVDAHSKHESVISMLDVRGNSVKRNVTS